MPYLTGYTQIDLWSFDRVQNCKINPHTYGRFFLHHLQLIQLLESMDTYPLVEGCCYVTEMYDFYLN